MNSSTDKASWSYTTVSSPSLALVAFALLLAFNAFAANDTQTTSTGTSSFGAVGFAIAYLTRRRAIGGWLFYYYMGAYVGCALQLLFLPAIISNIAPNGWVSAKLYVLYLASTVPVVLSLFAQVIAATRLLIRRNERSVQILRIALAALFLTTAASIPIDVIYFNSGAEIALDALTLFSSGVWSLYFWKSVRVRKVFIENSWNADGAWQKAPPRTPQERRYILKRTGIVTAVTFVVLLILVGVVMGYAKPNSELFTTPCFYAVVAAIISALSPISKKKRAALAGTN